MEKEKQISVEEYEAILDDKNRNYIAITFGGDIYFHCNGWEARKIQMRSGGCIRNHSESFEDVKEAYRDTYSTFHSEEETENFMSDYDQKVSKDLFLK